MDEKQLLNEFIKSGLLGDGEATFEVNVGIKTSKMVDMIFEKPDEIWLIEAKQYLNHEARGQVSNYMDLYKLKSAPKKEIKLGIVCENTNTDIEHVCQSSNIRVFVYQRDFGLTTTNEASKEKKFMCGVCGEYLKEKDGKLICDVCEHFFETTGKIEECIICHNKFAHFPAIDHRVEGIAPSNQKLWDVMCPECRKQRFHSLVGDEWSYNDTTKEMIRAIIKSKSLIIRDLEFRGIPREFIEYCIGKRNFH